MAKSKAPPTMPGWERIASGIEVIDWSTLASWDQQNLQLNAATDQIAFNAHWPNIDKKFGRWLCWIAFGVGAESIVKGAFGVKGYFVENFGACHPWKKHLNMPDSKVLTVQAAIHNLATDVRNRDAHKYVAGVRNADFSSIPSFVHALNDVLDCLKTAGLQNQIATHFSK